MGRAPDVLARLAAIVKWLVLIPVLALVALLALANDHVVPVRLNPFEPADPALQIELALYQVAFLVFALGALVGGLVAWLNQLRHRRRLQREQEEAERWRIEAEEKQRARAAHVGLLAGPSGGRM
jgi:uncharacterized integral membrane protein